MISHLLKEHLHSFNPVESFVELYLLLIVTEERREVVGYLSVLRGSSSFNILYLLVKLFNELRLLGLLHVNLKVLLFLRDLIDVERTYLVPRN